MVKLLLALCVHFVLLFNIATAARKPLWSVCCNLKDGYCLRLSLVIVDRNPLHISVQRRSRRQRAANPGA